MSYMPILRHWWFALLCVWVTFGLIDTVSATGASVVRDENQNTSNSADWPAWLVLEIPLAGTLGAILVPVGVFLLVRRLRQPDGDDSRDQPN